jgi:predicted anti-sigma-YlaC factor YlaD
VNCRGVVIEISEYLDGELDPALKIELELHISNCKDCRLVVDTTRKTIEIFCNSDPVALPVDVRHRLHEALAKRLERRPSQHH